MFRLKQELRIPGPVPVPANVLLASARPMINHRGVEFKHKLPQILERLKPVFFTKDTVLALTGSGTAAMEAAVANLVSPGDPVLVLVGGSFGQRWAELCQSYGADLHVVSYPWGTGVDPQAVKEALDLNPDIEVVFATHNESSTAVLNDIESIGEVVKNYPALLVVDAVSSLGGSPLETDSWGIDMVCAASQKCLMTPPGLAFVSVSQRARERMEGVTSPRYYLNLLTYEKMLAKGEPPFTPNLANFFALDEALDMIYEEGLDNMFIRHMLMRDMVRVGMEALELELLVLDKWASPTVTSVRPEGFDVVEFCQRLREQYGLELAGGQGKFTGEIFRIGHMGYATPLDMLTTLAAIECCLGRYGVATAPAGKLWNQWIKEN